MPVIQVPVIKGGKGAFVEIDTDKIPEDVYAEMVKLGAKVLVNRGTSKITATTYPNEGERQAAAKAKAAEQVEAIMTSKIKFTGGKSKSKGTGGAVMTEARRIAKGIVKDLIKAQGKKISHYEPKEITAAANALLESETGPDIIKQAEANLAERANVKPAIDLSALLQPSEKMVAKAEAAAAKKKEKAPLSAKQAGKTAKRSKKAAQPTA